MKKILLMGHPNVGKSVFFNRLTGAHVIESNYPGTTVDYTKGYMKLDGEDIEIIDVPGTFSVKPKDKAEEVAAKMLEANKDAYAPPYTPAIFLLPLSLAIIYPIRNRRRAAV